ncbi:hypothetical protein BOTCAL_0229g00010 [Botryotinia calthae]|uniref:Uncharacterized protein n=1 Tax=Botryotinia calthae TaxID=38488 RepID=A0A4Y8CXT1_9HELO|nr:hypothetical protein BOTCAL_0229g00010 [Botryotinia calthae]
MPLTYICSPCSGRLGGCLAVTDFVDAYLTPAVLLTELPMQFRSDGTLMTMENVNRLTGNAGDSNNFDILKTKIVLASLALWVEVDA